jgi:hypothetical protein
MTPPTPLGPTRSYLPPDYDMEEEAVIQQSGQHRAAALVQLFSQKSDYTGYTKKLFHAETVSDLGWVCDIADGDSVTAEYYELVRPNRHDQYKEADQGTFFANLKAAGDLLSDDKKITVFANESHWTEWATQTVGLPKASVSRFYQLIKDDKISALVFPWVQLGFGRETFVVSHWTSMQSQRMMQFWTRRLKKFWADFTMVTDGFTDTQRQNVSKADLSMILATSHKEQVMSYLDALRVLFFPKPADYNDNKVTGIPVDKAWWGKGSAGRYKQYTIAPPAVAVEVIASNTDLKEKSKQQMKKLSSRLLLNNATRYAKQGLPSCQWPGSPPSGDAPR